MAFHLGSQGRDLGSSFEIKIDAYQSNQKGFRARYKPQTEGREVRARKHFVPTSGKSGYGVFDVRSFDCVCGFLSSDSAVGEREDDWRERRLGT